MARKEEHWEGVASTYLTDAERKKGQPLETALAGIGFALLDVAAAIRELARK